MGIEIGPIPLFADATNTISSLLHNSTYKQGGTRHHKIKVSCMYQYVKRGVVHPICIPSGENVADVLTKSVVPKKLFFEFTDMMFGNGETYELNINLTKGTVSGFEQYAGLKRGYIVTDADISYGNSGGSAVDSNGELLGIPTLGKTEGASWIGYLISVDVVLEWLESINYFQADDISIPQLKIEEVDISSIPKYNRNDWNSWIDEDFDCQNTRHEVLQLESLVNVIFTNTDNCYVQSGKWFDPYNGEYFYFASDIEIDHFIPLYNVHISGGWEWSSELKTIFANNLDKPDILIPIKKSTNRSKSAQTPDYWKPENESYWCEYALDWIRIKHQWNLSATQNEWDALLDMIESCPSGINYETAVNDNHKFTKEKIRIYERND